MQRFTEIKKNLFIQKGFRHDTLLDRKDELIKKYGDIEENEKVIINDVVVKYEISNKKTGSQTLVTSTHQLFN
jgi:hypothetical protein